MAIAARVQPRRSRHGWLSPRGVGRLIAVAMVWLGGLACIAPPAYILGLSLMTPSRGRFSRPAVLNYISVLEDYRLWNAFKNTAIQELIILATTLFFCPLAGYAFAKFRFRGKKILFSVMILTLFFVPIAELIPLLLEMNEFGWLDTYQGLVAPLAVSSVGIFWMVMVIRDVPDEVLDASRLDGCGSFSTWWRIVMPLIKPSLLVLGFFIFMTAYNDYIWPLLVLPSDSMQTIQLYLQGGGGGPYGGGGGSPAAIVITSLPVIVVFVMMQRYYMPGALRRTEVPVAAEIPVFPFQTDAAIIAGVPGTQGDTHNRGARATTLQGRWSLALPLSLIGLRPWASARSAMLTRCAVIVGCTFLAYLDALRNRFQLDDIYRINGNPGVENFMPFWRHFTDPYTSTFVASLAQYRPLLPLSLSLNHALTGNSVAGYRLGNVIILAIASIVVYFLVSEILRHWTAVRIPTDRADFLALAVALLTAIHPVAAMLVSYISGRDLLLMQVFLGASILVYVRSQRLGLLVDRGDMQSAPTYQRLLIRWFGGSWTGWALSLILFELAMLSKAQAVAGVALILAFELTLGKGSMSRFATYARTLPFALAAVGHIAYIDNYLNFAALPDGPSLPQDAVWTYPLTQSRLSVLHYLPNFAWPFNMRMVPVQPIVNNLQDPGVLLGLAIIVGSLVLARLIRRANPLVAFCILAYWIAQSPESSVTPMLHNAVDYRPFPAGPFLFLGAAYLLNRYLKPAQSSVLLLLLMLFFGGATLYMNTVW